jgi:hypothetical protein
VAPEHEVIRQTLDALRLRLRLARAACLAIRALLLALLLASALLLVKNLFPAAAPMIAAALLVGVTTAGALFGLMAPAPLERVARLADRALRLKERLTSALEHLDLPEPSDLARAQLADAAAHLRGLQPGRVFPLRLPPEARLLLPAGGLLLALLLLPPLPLRLATSVGEEAAGPKSTAEAEPSAEQPPIPKLATPTRPEERPRQRAEEQPKRGPLSPRDQPGDLAASFRDTKLGDRRPDFGSFIKQGDERLRMLARPESLPDLSRDATQSQHQVLIRRMQERLKAGGLQGLSWEEIERLLSELGRSQPGGGGDLADELREELKGQGGGDRTLSALSRALNRLRDRDEAARGKGRSLTGAPGGQDAPGKGEGGDGTGKEEGAQGGTRPGTGVSSQPVGEVTPRIAGEKQDANLSGDPREGQSESYDTNLSGPGTSNPSRMPYLNLLSRYRKMMEEALAKEPIPFNYREQVKDYFQSLEAR